MAYTNHSHRNVLAADASLNDLYTNEKYRGLSGESVSRVAWIMDRGRSYSDTQSSPAADHRAPKSATSPASHGSGNQTFRRSMKHLTCPFWADERCTKSSETCWYAHEHTGKLAQKPVQVEPGKPAVAGRNALNPRPVYVNWQEVHSRSATLNRGSGIQQQVNYGEAKAVQNNPHTGFEAYVPNLKTMHAPQRDSAPESANSLHNNLDMLSNQPTTSREPAELSPSIGHFASRQDGAFNQPFGKDPTNYSPTAHYGAAAPTHQTTQQTSPGHYQAHCPHPIDHIMFDNLKYEQTKMMRYKAQSIYRFASEIDLAIETMEESQKSNERDIQKLIHVARGKVEKADLARTQGEDESPHRGGGKFFSSNGAYQLNTHAPASAPMRRITGVLSYNANRDLPYELTAIAERLSQTHSTAENNIARLKNAKQMLGFNFEKIGEQDALPKGWIQHDSPK